jgi:hypothetical protein
MAEWDPVWTQQEPPRASPKNRKPKPILWEWRVFGGDEMIVKVTDKKSLFFRMKTRFFLGSRWKKVYKPK